MNQVNPKSTYTIQTIAVLLKAGRGTVRKYLQTDEFKAMIKITEKKINRFGFELLIPFEEFEAKYIAKREFERKNATTFAREKNPKNQGKVIK